MAQAAAIDVHAHLYPREYMGRAAELAGEADEAARAAAFTVNHPIIRNDPVFIDPEVRVPLMDVAGVQTQILSFAAPNVFSRDPAERSETVRIHNDALLRIAAAYPGRFGLFANLPLPFTDQACSEVDRVAGAPGVVGWSISAHYPGRTIDDPEFERLWSRLDRDGALVYVHPDAFSVPDVLADYGMEWTLGATFDDTIVTLRLIVSGILDRYPRILWIIPHLGGTVPVLRGRFDLGWHLMPEVRKRLERPPSEYVPRLMFDAATLQPSAIRFAVEALGEGNVLYGSDYPYVHREDPDGANAVLRSSGLPDAEQDAIRRGNFLERCSPYLAPGCAALLPHLAPR